MTLMPSHELRDVIRREGGAIDQMAAALGCSTRTVHRLLGAAGLRDAARRARQRSGAWDPTNHPGRAARAAVAAAVAGRANGDAVAIVLPTGQWRALLLHVTRPRRRT